MRNINECYWNKKSEFCRFVHSRQVSDNKKNIESLRDSNNKHENNIDKIHVLKEHYQKLGREKHVESFENEWKIHVQSRIREYERLSVDIT